jgi:hypothetical protein
VAQFALKATSYNHFLLRFPTSCLENITSTNMASRFQSAAPHSVYDNKDLRYPSLKSQVEGRDRAHNIRISKRTLLKQDTVTLQGWPSRGGIIVLQHATAPDFVFLGLDPLNPPLRRSADQDAEDAFCKALLRLGATWWDSESRRSFVRKLKAADEEAFDAVEADEALEPTRLERGWVRVAWPAHSPGALCVLACEELILGRAGDEKLKPEHYGLLTLARTMEERYTVLQCLGGTIYGSIDEYEGPTFLKAWEENHQGEKGPLVRYEFIDPSSYGGHPDEALGLFNQSI